MKGVGMKRVEDYWGALRDNAVIAVYHKQISKATDKQSQLRNELVYQQMITDMHNQYVAMFHQLMQLESIAPRRIKVGDQELVYRCPPHMIPMPPELNIEVPKSKEEETKPTDS